MNIERIGRLQEFSDMYNQSTSLIPVHIVKEIVHFMAKDIANTFREKENILIITVINNAAHISSMIQQKLSLIINYEVGYIDVTKNMSVENGLELNYMNIPKDVSQHSVLIISGLSVTGVTLHQIRQLFKNVFLAKEVYTAVFLHKDKKMLESKYVIDFIGRTISENDFVFGMGMSLNNHWSGLPEIRKVNIKNL